MKRTHIILLVVIAVAFGVIITTVGEVSSYETFKTASVNEGKSYHIVGEFVEQKGLEYNPEANANVFSFYMIDTDGAEYKVICNDDKPQDFELTDQIVVVGKMKGDLFYASQLLTKCPSKYAEEEVATNQAN